MKFWPQTNNSNNFNTYSNFDQTIGVAGGGITEKPDYLIPGFMTVRSILVRPHFVAEDFVFDVVCILLQYNTTTTVYYLSYRIVIIANRHVFFSQCCK